MRAGLSVADVAEALGTSPQTVRALLRKGQLHGEQRPWGSRYVWEVSPEGLDAFLSQYGRLDGRRRGAVLPAGPEPGGAAEPDAAPEASAPSSAPLVPDPAARETEVPETEVPETEVPETEVPGPRDLAPPERLDPPSVEDEPVDRRPLLLRPRGRATVVVVVLGLPILVAYAAVRTLPDALWFHELGQSDLFTRVLAAKVQLQALVAVTVAVVLWANVLVACRGTWVVRRRRWLVALAAAALVIGSLFGFRVAEHWQTYLLWRHAQSFGVLDPVFGKDVGFFVFTLPFEVLVSTLLLALLAVSVTAVLAVHVARGTVTRQPLRATFEAQVHLAVLAAAFLLVVAWRSSLERYLLELQQPDPVGSRTFAGEGYVDLHVRTPGLEALAYLCAALAVASLVAPFLARWTGARLTKGLVLAGSVGVVGVVVAMGVVPALVQRFSVDPNPLLREAPYLVRSTTATRYALGLDRIAIEPYAPTGRVTAADYASVERRLDRVATWDAWLLGDRMRQMVSDTPYFRPDQPALDVVRVDGRLQPTVVSARELDPGSTRLGAQSWSSDRLAYTHGLGLIRFSATDVGPDREPRLLDSGLGVRQPRIYFGDLPRADAPVGGGTSSIFAPTPERGTAHSPWVLVDTERAEVDIRASLGSPRAAYHYQGPAGIQLSSWERRAVFAAALGSKQLLLSDDITSRSRILLHRDVHERLATLAPFLHWDSDAVPLDIGGRILFVVDGYTTSTHYPYAAQTDLGGTQVGYARASVRATVDAYTGRVRIYLTEPDDPIARAWAEAFPSLFLPGDAMPAAVQARARYPRDLFEAQATAFERFHTESPDVLASGSDVWSRPVALAGPLEVAGGVDFDESDEDDLRLTLQPAYAYATPPGRDQPQLALTTYFVPRQGQNLVATLTGWVDAQGRTRLVSRSLPRDPVTLGPAQISRLVFATPRVRNLLGLRNLEIRDLDTSSLDAVFLGLPHILFVPGGVVQVQSLYEGSRGPGAARLLGITVFVNGRAGLGPDMASALRQVLNEPPSVDVARPGQAVVGTPVTLRYRVENTRREVITVTSGSGSARKRVTLRQGEGTVRWVPRRPGRVRFRVTAIGLDGTRTSDATGFRVLSRPPAVRIVRVPRQVVVGEPVRVPFRVDRGRRALAQVSTRTGIVFARIYLLRGHTGVVQWTPEAPGAAVLRIRARGGQGQTVSTSLRLRVRPQVSSTPPSVTLVRVPDHLTAGEPATFVLQADGCRVVLGRISGPGEEVPVWRFPCPVGRGRISWTPAEPGTYRFTAVARGPEGLTASQRVSLQVGSSPSRNPATGTSSEPTAGPGRGATRHAGSRGATW